MQTSNFKSRLLGRIAGVFGFLFSRRNENNTAQKLEFKTSTQRMGISFTEKIRDAFRHRWIKKS